MITLDLETIPTQNEEFKADIKATLKRPKTTTKCGGDVDALMEEMFVEKWQKTALDPAYGTIVCICADINGVEYSWCGPDELKLISDFNSVMEEFKDEVIITHYGKMFDMPFLARRSWVNGLPNVFEAFPGPASQSVMDTREMWCGSYNKQEHIKLNKLASIFGLGSKTADGSDVFSMWFEGDFDAIEKYCMEDVKLTLAVFRKLNVGV